MPIAFFERVPSTPPVILPLPAGAKRLQWSVMILLFIMDKLI